MVSSTSIIATSALVLGAAAYPQTVPTNAIITAETLIKIAPSTASCAGAPFPEECHDATIAAPAISDSFAKYGITTKGEQAALLAIMLFESGNFQYNKNHYPGVPGQGTKNMQSPQFNTLYATALFPEAVAGAQAQGPDAVLQLVSKPNETFGSAAWFLTTQCGPAIKAGLTNDIQGYHAYLSGCVGVQPDEGRNAIWNAAIAGL